jgi:hypothetical protein
MDLGFGQAIQYLLETLEPICIVWVMRIEDYHSKASNRLRWLQHIGWASQF